MQTHWVFGYGSLMWNPGFAYLRRERAVLHGAHRRFCVYSFHHRGTRDCPGLVLGLDRGGCCIGFAFEVAHENWAETYTYLREREQRTEVYHEVRRRVRLATGETVRALTYMVDPGHAQYAGRLPLEKQVERIMEACGESGPNPDYAINTVAHLRQAGIHDSRLERLERALRQALHENGLPRALEAGRSSDES